MSRKKQSGDNFTNGMIVVAIILGVVGSVVFILLPLAWLYFEFRSLDNRRPSLGFQLTSDEYTSASRAMADIESAQGGLGAVLEEAEEAGCKERTDGNWDERNRAAPELNRARARFESEKQQAITAFNRATSGPERRFKEWAFVENGVWGGRAFWVSWFFATLIVPAELRAEFAAILADASIPTKTVFAIVPAFIGAIGFGLGYVSRRSITNSFAPRSAFELVTEFSKYDVSPSKEDRMKRYVTQVAELLPPEISVPSLDALFTVCVAILARHIVEADGVVSDLEREAVLAMEQSLVNGDETKRETFRRGFALRPSDELLRAVVSLSALMNERTGGFVGVVRMLAELDGAGAAETRRIEKFEEWAKQVRDEGRKVELKPPPRNEEAQSMFGPLIGLAAALGTVLLIWWPLDNHEDSERGFTTEFSISAVQRSPSKVRDTKVWSVGNRWVYQVSRRANGGTDESAAIDYVIVREVVRLAEHDADLIVTIKESGGISKTHQYDLNISETCIRRAEPAETWFCGGQPEAVVVVNQKEVPVVNFSDGEAKSQFAPNIGVLTRTYQANDRVTTETLIGWKTGASEFGMARAEVFTCDWNAEVVKTSPLKSKYSELAAQNGLTGKVRQLDVPLSGRAGLTDLTVLSDATNSLMLFHNESMIDRQHKVGLPVSLAKVWEDPRKEVDHVLLVFADSHNAWLDVLSVSVDETRLRQYEFERSPGSKDYYGGFLLASEESCYIQLRNKGPTSTRVRNLDLKTFEQIGEGSLMPVRETSIDLMEK